MAVRVITAWTYRMATIILLLLAAACIGGAPPARRDVPPGHTFTLHAPNARTISVAGSFNRWDPSAHHLTGPDRSGTWTMTLPLPPGNYEYLFVIDGEAWVLDPPAPSVDNGLGGRNSIVTVTGGSGGGK